MYIYKPLESTAEYWGIDPSSGWILGLRSSYSQRKRTIVWWKEVLVSQFNTGLQSPPAYEWQVIKYV